VEVISLGTFLQVQDTGKIFISFLLCNAIISLVLYLFAIQWQYMKDRANLSHAC